MGRAFEFRKARKLKRWSAMAKSFTKIGKELSIAVKDSGPNPETNPRLRAIIQNAKAVNMPKENIERAIKKASEKSSNDYKEIVFEGYGPKGVAIIVEAATDNNNRTVANIRSYFNKFDGTLSTSGSVEFMFDRICCFKIQTISNLDDLEFELIDYGLDELIKDEIDNQYLLYSGFDKFGSIQKELENRRVEIISTEFERIPKQYKFLKNEEAITVENLLEKINEDDDVQNIFHNMQLSYE